MFHGYFRDGLLPYLMLCVGNFLLTRFDTPKVAGRQSTSWLRKDSGAHRSIELKRSNGSVGVTDLGPSSGAGRRMERVCCVVKERLRYRDKAKKISITHLSVSLETLGMVAMVSGLRPRKHPCRGEVTRCNRGFMAQAKRVLADPKHFIGTD